jgi:hypothetical protein
VANQATIIATERTALTARIAELESQLAARPALEWIPARDAPNGSFIGRLINDNDPRCLRPIFEVDEMDDRDREHGWSEEKYDYVIPLDALPPAPKPPETG